MEEEYVTGDIVLLSHSKLGVMTSSFTVREIRGDDTEFAINSFTFVKKLTSKELAETLVDLMERYANLEIKASQLLKEGTITNTASTNTTKTTSYTKHTKSSKTTSSSEPKPKSINNDLDIPKTPNYAHTIHTVSPRESMQHQYYGHQQNVYNNKKREREREPDTPSTKSKSNDESGTNTTNTSTISSLSPNTNTMDNMEQHNNKKSMKNSKKKNKLFAKIRKTSKKKTENGFLFKNKRKKEDKTRKNKRSSSSESHQNYYIKQQMHYEYPHIEYTPYPHEYAPYAYDQLPFSHIRSNPDDYMHQMAHLDGNNAPKTRFARSKSTENYPYHHTNAEHHIHRYHNPYFIAYTPSHHTNNSATTTPPIPSPSPYHPHHAPYHHHYIHTHHNHPAPNAYPHPPTAHPHPPTAHPPTAHPPTAHPHPPTAHPPTAHPPIPMSGTSPYALYNRYYHHMVHPHYYCSTPNIETPMDATDSKADKGNGNDNGNDKLIDVLLSVPHVPKKQSKNKELKKKSHPISYKKRTIKHVNTDGNAASLLMTSRTALTESVSPSQSGCAPTTPPTYPQAYTHNHNQMVLNLLNSPEPQSVVNPIIDNYNNLNHLNSNKHLQNRSNTMDTEDTTHNREIYGNYNNNYIENSCSQSKRQIMNQYISSATQNNDSMIGNDSSIRGGSHSPRNSSYSYLRTNKNYHSSYSPRFQSHKRPFSATNKHKSAAGYNHNYFDFGAKQRIYHSKHSKSNTNTIFSEIEGKNEYSSQNKTAAIKPFHPHTQIQTTTNKYKKPKLTQNYSSPLQHERDEADYFKLKQMQYHKQRGKTMGNDINLDELGMNMNENRWYITSDISSDNDTQTDAEDIREIETVIHHNNSCNEGRKSQSFSVLALGKSLDDMTPLVLSPQSKHQKHHHHKRSQSVATIFDPIQPSFLADLHKSEGKKDHNAIKIKNTENNNKLSNNYRITLSKEDSNKAFYIQDNLTPKNTNKNNKLIAKPRFSESGQSGQSNTSFTPTISQTPSYLREDIKWDKSMTMKPSQTAVSSQCSTESDDRWMLHNQINVNGNTAAAFWGNDEFPDIETGNGNDHNDMESSNTKISHHDIDIANHDELEKIMQIKRKYNKNALSPTGNTSDTDTISKSYIY